MSKSKPAKRRMCPAIGQEITSAECGENRGSKYACPAECSFSPLAPANYGQLLDLESTVDRKTAEWLFSTAPDKNEFNAGIRAADKHKSGLALHAFFAHEIFFRKNGAGLTCAQRWEAKGFPGLKNDEQVVLRAKMKMRAALLEVHRVIDDEQVEAVDLLQEPPTPFVIRDRSMASYAGRFATFLCWTYPLPHYGRMHGTAMLLPDLQVFEAREMILEIVRHLGGPLEQPGLSGWLADHFTRVEESITAISVARQRLMFEGMDAEFGKVIYELRKPFSECREALDAAAGVAEDSIAEAESSEGFAEARVWFEEHNASGVAAPLGGKQVLGRVLLGQSHWRLEALGEEKTSSLRHAFEKLMGRRVTFSGQRMDSIGKSMADTLAKPDPALIPLRLLEQPPKVCLSSSRIEPPPNVRNREELEASMWASQDQAWLEEPVPALAGKTPRAAARDAALRPALVRLMKSRVRQCDERNLKNGSSTDVNWMLRELALNEINFPPPPSRQPPLDLEDDDDDDDDDNERFSSAVDLSLPLAPPLPARPFTPQESHDSARETMQSIDLAGDALEEMQAAGSTLVEQLEEITAGLLDDQRFPLLIPFLIQIWFLFVPPGTRGPELDPDRLRKGILGELEAILALLKDGSDDSFKRFMSSGAQPGAAEVFTTMMFEITSKLPKNSRPSPEHQGVMAAVLIAVIAELDQACREQL